MLIYDWNLKHVKSKQEMHLDRKGKGLSIHFQKQRELCENVATLKKCVSKRLVSVSQRLEKSEKGNGHMSSGRCLPELL